MTNHMKPAVGRKLKVIQATNGEKFFVGVDVHKRSYSVAIWSDQRGHVSHWTQPAAPGGADRAADRGTAARGVDCA